MTLMRDDADQRPPWGKMTLMSDDADERPHWRKTTLRKNDPDERSPWRKTTLSRNDPERWPDPEEKPLWGETTLIRDHPEQRWPCLKLSLLYLIIVLRLVLIPIWRKQIKVCFYVNKTQIPLFPSHNTSSKLSCQATRRQNGKQRYLLYKTKAKNQHIANFMNNH